MRNFEHENVRVFCQLRNKNLRLHKQLNHSYALLYALFFHSARDFDLSDQKSLAYCQAYQSQRYDTSLF